MSKELVIGSNRHETKVAILEEDQLVEIYFQRGNEYSLAGSIHKGRVTRVLPGMQSAFVDLGLERDTFLYVSDFLEEHEDFDRVTGDERPMRHDERPPRHQERRPSAPPSEQQLPPPVESPAETPVVNAAAAAPSPAHEPRGELAEEIEEVEHEHEAGPAVAPLLDEEEDLDIQAMILGDVEGIEIEPSAEGAKSEEGTEPREGSAE